MRRPRRHRASLACAVVLCLASHAACTESSRPQVAPAPPTATLTARGDAAATVARESDSGADPPSAAASDAGGARCGSGAWAMYAHDATRTSASDGCVEGALRVASTFTPKGPCGYRSRLGRVQHVVSDGDGVFASGDCGDAPAVWRVDASGTSTWTMSRADFSLSTWPAIAGDAIVSVDDGVFLIDRATGKWHGRELDVWGEPIVIGDQFFVDNTFQLDGAGPFVARFDATLHWLWKASQFDGARGKHLINVGGIAVARGIVVDAASVGPRGAPQLSAHDAMSGERKWTAAKTWPESAPSIADDRVYLLERWNGEKDDRLVARDLASGTVAWSHTIGWARGTPPAITPKLVLVHARDGLGAYDRATGAPVWTAPIPRTTPLVQSITTIAVALGSGTIVVTSGPRIAVVRLDDGKEIWSADLVKGPSAVVSSPIVVGRTVHVVRRTLTDMGTLLRLEPDGGAR